MTRQQSQNTTDRNGNSTHVNKLANLQHQMPKFSEHGSITQCRDRLCPLHNHLLHASQIRSRVTKRMYNTHGVSICNTRHIVYAIQRKKCTKQYVGQTSQSLKGRFARHLTQVKNPNLASTLHEHFRTSSRSGCLGMHNISITPLHVITPEHNEDEKQLKQLETLWINRLKCEYP